MSRRVTRASILFLAALPAIRSAQQTLGGITGVAPDASGSAVPGAAIAIKDLDTNIEVKATAQNNGAYQVLNRRWAITA